MAADKFNCPKCGSYATVTNTVVGATGITRYRVCAIVSCGMSFSTIETLKKDGCKSVSLVLHQCHRFTSKGNGTNQTGDFHMAKKPSGAAAQAAAADIASGALTTGAPIDSNETNIHANQPNDTRLEDGVKFIRELGRDAALGKDSLPKLAFQFTKMAAEGVIDLEKKYEGDDKYDDAEFLFNEYSKAEGKKAIHERSTGGLKANISKARQFVAFGMLTTCDPQDVLERAATVRKGMLTDGDKVKSAYAAYVDVAREQQKLDTDMNNDQLAGVIRKAEKASPELRKIIDGVFKKLEKLYTDGIDAANNLRDRLAEIDAANQPDQTDEEVEAQAEEVVAQLGARGSDKLEALLAKLGYGKVAA